MDQHQSNQQKTYRQLLETAKQAAKNTYSPYSKYPVGAALLGADGRIFSGCNVENASYGGTICAERTAVVKAVSEGCTAFSAIAIICEKANNCWPCGFCRQFISEFGIDIDVIVEAEDGSINTLKLGELLPHNFGAKDLV
jgi:cytidine deaminase